MEEQPDLFDPIFAMKYWQAAITFGDKAVDTALEQSPWRERFPGIVAGSVSPDITVMGACNSTLLPGDLIYGIAGRDDLRYEFYTSADKERLYSMDRRKPFDAKEWLTLTPRQALSEYGAYAMFYSVDNMYGTKGQIDPSLR